VPLAHEPYELAIPQAVYEGETLRPLLTLLADDAFRAAVAAMPGYDTSVMGRTRFVE
jgi:putative molybdopterin biosynthesis protein